MAYISSEDVKVIRENIKKSFPSKDGWKISVTKHHCTTIVVAIMQSPKKYNFEGYVQVNHYYIEKDSNFTDEQKSVLKKLVEIISKKHWDKSDIMTDYFHCAFFIQLYIGKWNKPCVSI